MGCLPAPHLWTEVASPIIGLGAQGHAKVTTDIKESNGTQVADGSNTW